MLTEISEASFRIHPDSSIDGVSDLMRVFINLPYAPLVICFVVALFVGIMMNVFKYRFLAGF